MWEDSAKQIMTTLKLFAHGCSDKGTMMIMGGAINGLLDDVSFDISGEQTWKMLTAPSTVCSWET